MHRRSRNSIGECDDLAAPIPLTPIRLWRYSVDVVRRQSPETRRNASIPSTPTPGTRINPFKLNEDYESIRTQYQKVKEENDRLNAELHLIENEVKVEKERLQAKKGEYQKEEETQVFPVLRKAFDESLLEKARAIQHKNLKFSIQNSIARLRTQIQSIQAENHQLSTEIADIGAIYEDMPTTQPRDYETLYEILWKGVLAGDERRAKQELKGYIAGLSKSGVKSWLKSMKLGLDEREISKMIGKAVRSDRFEPRIFLSILSRYQPYPLFEDISPILAHLRIHLALQNRSYSEFEMMVENWPKDAKEARKRLEKSPLDLSTENAGKLVGYLGKNQPVVETYAPLLSDVPPWPLLRDIVTYARFQIVLGISITEMLIPVPCCLPALRNMLRQRFQLTSDAAVIFAAAILESKQPPMSAFWDIVDKRLENLPQASIGTGFNSFVAKIRGRNWKTIAERIRQFVQPANLVFVPSPCPTKTLLDLEEFLRECQILVSDMNADERFAVEVKCFARTKIIGALDYTQLENEVEGVIKSEDLTVDFSPAVRPEG